MRSATLLALSLMAVGVWSQDSASAQGAPLSLASPKASAPSANTRNSPAASGRASSTPATGGLLQSPNPAADYDGFSVGTADDNDHPDQATRPMTSRRAKGTKPDPDAKGAAAQQLIDQEDDALKRKLTICKNCK